MFVNQYQLELLLAQIFDQEQNIIMDNNVKQILSPVFSCFNFNSSHFSFFAQFLHLLLLQVAACIASLMNPSQDLLLKQMSPSLNFVLPTAIFLYFAGWEGSFYAIFSQKLF